MLQRLSGDSLIPTISINWNRKDLRNSILLLTKNEIHFFVIAVAAVQPELTSAILKKQRGCVFWKLPLVRTVHKERKSYLQNRSNRNNYTSLYQYRSCASEWVSACAIAENRQSIIWTPQQQQHQRQQQPEIDLIELSRSYGIF